MAEIINENELQNVSGGAYTGACFYYTIVWGDTLSGIAQRFHTTIAILMQLNPSIKDPNKIYAGNKILVPAQ